MIRCLLPLVSLLLAVVSGPARCHATPASATLPSFLAASPLFPDSGASQTAAVGPLEPAAELGLPPRAELPSVLATNPEASRGPRVAPALAAQSPATPPEGPGSWSDISGLRSFGWWAAGAATGFFAHESGHVFANLVQGNVPKLKAIWGLGFVPFFAIEPRIGCDDRGHCVKHDGSAFHGGVGGAAAITSAGFNVQHLTDEVLLSRRPNLRHDRVAPFRKGLLAFNILLSVGYAITSTTHIENPQGDVSSSTRLMGYPRAVYAAQLVAIAGLDTYRYFWPGSRWAPWVSRASKLAFFGAVFAF